MFLVIALDSINFVSQSYHVNAIVTESIRYWESRRLLYNLALILVVLGFVFCFQPPASELFTVHTIVGLMAMAAIANLLYCFGYVADIFVQMSEYQQAWKRRRWFVFVAGTVLAAFIFYITRN